MSYEEEDTYLGTDQVHIIVRRVRKHFISLLADVLKSQSQKHNRTLLFT
jgi:hypothetical protein